MGIRVSWCATVKQMNLNLKSEKGYSLIEILVVISILAILSLGIWVALGSVRDDARHKSVLSDLKLIQTRAHVLFTGSTGFGPEFAQTNSCILSLFSDQNITDAVNSIVLKSSGLTRCAVGEGGRSFAFSIQSAEYSICVNEFIVKTGLAQGGGSEEARCE